MVNTRRALAVALVAVGAMFAADRVDATDRQQPAGPDAVVAPTFPRLRSDDPVVTALIRDATDRSMTFRRLVDAIQASDGIVYIVRGRCSRYVRTCLAFSITVAGPNRLLHVIVDERKTGIEAIVSIAHELQHVREVLDHPDVRTAGEMHGLFERIGTWRRFSFETRAAVEVTDAVRAELPSRSRSPRSASSAR